MLHIVILNGVFEVKNLFSKDNSIIGKSHPVMGDSYGAGGDSRYMQVT